MCERAIGEYSFFFQKKRHYLFFIIIRMGELRPTEYRTSDLKIKEPFELNSIERAKSYKLEGNDAYRKEFYLNAMKLYETALQTLSIPLNSTNSDPKETLELPEVNSAQKQKVKNECTDDSGDVRPLQENQLIANLFLNLGLCTLKTEIDEGLNLEKSSSPENRNTNTLRRDRAIRFFTSAIKHNKQYGKAYYRRADCHMDSENFSTAHADYVKSKEVGFADLYLDVKIENARKKMEEQTAKALQDLKSLGSSILGKFGLSLDNFKTKKNESGGYSISYEN